MKTPEEIKKSLECMKKAFDEKCDFNCDRCPVYVPGYKTTSTGADALAYIWQLEAELEASKRERKALMLDFQTCVKRTRKVCSVCSNKGKPICNECEGCDVFEWRGVCPENMEVSPDA